MEKQIYDESNGLWYELHGDYYLPHLTVLEEWRPVGVWGQRHLQYLRRHKKAVYDGVLLDGMLNEYLAELNEQAEEMFLRLVKELAEKEGVTEKFKAEDQMEWVRRVNGIHNRAMEVVNDDLIYV